MTGYTLHLFHVGYFTSHDLCIVSSKGHSFLLFFSYEVFGGRQFKAQLNFLLVVSELFLEKSNLSSIHYDMLAHLCKCVFIFMTNY